MLRGAQLVFVLLLGGASLAHPESDHPHSEGCPFAKSRRTDFSRSMEERNLLARRAREATSSLFVNLSLLETEDNILEGGFGSRRDYLRMVKVAEDACSHEEPTCDQQDVRSISGQCNNLKNPLWGAANRPLLRSLPADYHDGKGEPRGGAITMEQLRGVNCTIESCGGELPTARAVSTLLSPDINIPSPHLTHMITTFGQFLSHDISLTPEALVPGCCLQPSMPDCFPIPVPGRDQFHSTRHKTRTCIEFSRSVPYCHEETAVREQFSTVTAFIDASTVYGSEDKFHALLRSGVGGKLLTNPDFKKDMPPILVDGKMTSGEKRMLEWPGLTALHTLFLREHNRLATSITARLPSLEDEAVFQLARKILIAELQNIVYTEYLPLVLGDKAMAEYGLDTVAKDHTVYMESEDPTVTNNFATVAFRFAHPMIQGEVWMVEPGLKEANRSLLLRNMFWDPAASVEDGGNGIEQMLAGMVVQPSRHMTQFVTQEITNFLFPFGKRPRPAEEPLPEAGNDLAAFDVQRGRDHGLPGYNSYRKLCGLPTIRSMEPADRPAELAYHNWESLGRLYRRPDHIDLMSAAVLEQPVEGGLVGPVLTCLMGRQFRSLMRGDRFFYTHGGEQKSFTANQLAAIRKRTMRDILCENTDIPEIGEEAFVLRSPLVNCAKGNHLDINLFFSRNKRFGIVAVRRRG